MKQEKVVNRVITDLVEEVSDDLTAKLDHDTKVVQRLKIRQMMRMRSQGASFADIAKRFYPEDDLAVATGRVRTQVNRIVKELRKKVDEKEGLTDEVLNNVL